MKGRGRIIEKIKRLDKWDRLHLYMDYYCTMLSLKYGFNVANKVAKGWGTPDKEYKGIGFYYGWTGIYIMEIEEFFSEKNIKIEDMGSDWEKRGFAQRYFAKISGAYEWYQKNEKQFNF